MSVTTLVGTPDPDPRPGPQLSVAVPTAGTARPAYVDVVLGGLAILPGPHPSATAAKGRKRGQRQGVAGRTKPIDALLRAVEDVHHDQHDRFGVDMCDHALCRAASEVDPNDERYAPWGDD